MSNFISQIWNWRLKRSPQNAAKPNVQPNHVDDTGGMNIPAGGEPIETYIETESILGSPIKIGFEEGALRDPNGQLVRAHNKLSIPIGCGHIAAQLQALNQQDRHIIGIAGPCFYCQQQLQESLSQGEITAFDAERLSLVCTDCGKITESGELCCPKHYKTVTNPDGTIRYLGPEDAKQYERQNITKAILSSITLLFGQKNQETPKQNIQEQSNGHASL